MKLVSGAKLRRTQSAIEGLQPFSNKLGEILSSLLLSDNNINTPYTREGECKTVGIIAISSDSGLCGTFNANIIRQVREVIDEYIAQGVKIEVYTVGKKVRDAIVKAGIVVNEELMKQSTKPCYNEVAIVARHLMERFCKGDVDRVEVVYTHFRSAAKQQPITERLLPVQLESLALQQPKAQPILDGGHSIGQEVPFEYIIEPCKTQLLDALLSKVIEISLYLALLDSISAEHAARTVAMQVATENAEELIASLTLEYNKGRQQTITNELLDIVSGSAAR